MPENKQSTQEFANKLFPDTSKLINSPDVFTSYPLLDDGKRYDKIPDSLNGKHAIYIKDDFLMADFKDGTIQSNCILINKDLVKHKNGNNFNVLDKQGNIIISELKDGKMTNVKSIDSSGKETQHPDSKKFEIQTTIEALFEYLIRTIMEFLFGKEKNSEGKNNNIQLFNSIIQAEESKDKSSDLVTKGWFSEREVKKKDDKLTGKINGIG